MNDIISYLVSMMVMSAFADSRTTSSYPGSQSNNGTDQSFSNEDSQTSNRSCNFNFGTVYIVVGITSGLLVYGLILTLLVLVLMCIHLRTRKTLQSMLIKYRHSNGSAKPTVENPEQGTELVSVKATIDAYEEIKDNGTVPSKEQENAEKKNNGVDKEGVTDKKNESADKDMNEVVVDNSTKRDSKKDVTETQNAESNNKSQQDKGLGVALGSFFSSDKNDENKEQKDNNEKGDGKTEVKENEKPKSSEKHEDKELKVTEGGEIKEEMLAGILSDVKMEINMDSEKGVSNDVTAENDDVTEL